MEKCRINFDLFKVCNCSVYSRPLKRHQLAQMFYYVYGSIVRTPLYIFLRFYSLTSNIRFNMNKHCKTIRAHFPTTGDGGSGVWDIKDPAQRAGMHALDNEPANVIVQSGTKMTTSKSYVTIVLVSNCCTVQGYF